MRPGLGYSGVENLQKFIRNGGVFVTSVGSAQFAIDFSLTNGVSMSTPSGRVVTVNYVNSLPSAISLAPDGASPPQPLLSQIQFQPFGPPKSWMWHMASGTMAHQRVYDLYGRMVRYPLGSVVRDLVASAPPPARVWGT